MYEINHLKRCDPLNITNFNNDLIMIYHRTPEGEPTTADRIFFESLKEGKSIVVL